MRHPLLWKLGAGLVFLVIYPGMIVFAAHQVEKRSDSKARNAERVATEKSNHSACVNYNAMAFAVNDFDTTLEGLLRTAKVAREREAAALKGTKSPRGQKLREAALKAINAYKALLASIHPVRYERGCRIPKKKVHPKSS